MWRLHAAELDFFGGGPATRPRLEAVGEARLSRASTQIRITDDSRYMFVSALESQLHLLPSRASLFQSIS